MAGARIFISYKRDHAPSLTLLRSLQSALLEVGYDVLIDEGIRGGDCWSKELYDWLLGCAGAVVIASSEATQSEWCRREWEVLAARAHAGARVVPVCVELPRDDLGPLKHLQSLDGLAPRIIAAVLDTLHGAVKPWQVGPDDLMALHHAWLRWQYRRAPVLGKEPFALGDVYIDTDCGQLPWDQLSAGASRGLDPFDENNGGRAPLLDTVLERFQDPAFRDVVVVQGPAGCGKSAFTLHLADQLISRGLEPLLVRFRDMNLASHDRVDELLEDAMRVGPESEQPAMPQMKVLDESRLRATTKVGEAAICKTVVILDGWDEVSLAGSTGYQAQLRTWLPRFREFFVRRGGAPVRVLVTGRPSLEVKESGFLLKDTPILTLRSIRPAQLRRFSDKLCEAWGVCVSKKVFDRYDRWFEKREQSGVEMLGQPLLAFLAIRSLGAVKDDIDSLLDSPSALYKSLIDLTVPHAARAEPGIQGTVHRGGRSLRELLQRVAALTSVFWSERISFEELEARLEGDETLSNWLDRETSDKPLHTLVVNFWFKGGHKDLGCEFLHKSFREYLFAEAIVECLLEVSEGHSGPLPPPRIPLWQDFAEGTIQHTASRALAKLLAPQWMTHEVRGHLFFLLEAAIREDRERWVALRDLLTDVYGWWAEGVHLRPQLKRRRGTTEMAAPFVDELLEWAMPYKHDGSAKPIRSTTLDGHLGDSLLQMTAFVYWCLHREEWAKGFGVAPQRPYQYLVGGAPRFRPGGDGFLHALAARIGAAGFRPLGRELSGSFLAGVAVVAEPGPAFLIGADLRHAILSAAELNGSDFRHALLRGAVLQRADMDGCNLSFADFSEADLRSANLAEAVCIATSFERADLAGTFLVRSQLDNVDFSRASLVGANFTRAIFRRPILHGADLTNVTLNGAVVTEGTLERASGTFDSKGVTFIPDHWDFETEIQ